MTKQHVPGTMEEFARLAGVSRPTLAKFFDDPDSIKPSTRLRIEAALETSDYQPNHYARNLNRKRTSNIGILVPTLLDPFYAAMVSHIEMGLRNRGFWPIVISSHGSAELEAEATRTLLSLRVAGAIVAPLGLKSSRRAFERLTQSISLVYFDTFIGEEVPFVGNDNRQSVSTMVEYLCRSGEPPAYFDIPHVNHNSTERLQSYIEAMADHSLEPRVLTSATDYTWDFERIGYEQMESLLSTGKMDAQTLLCANDRLAYGVIAAAFAMNRKVGRKPGCDFRVAAHDDHPLSRYTSPALTTMAQDSAAIASLSVEALMTLLDGAPGSGKRSRRALPATLVMRQSA